MAEGKHLFRVVGENQFGPVALGEFLSVTDAGAEIDRLAGKGYRKLWIETRFVTAWKRVMSDGVPLSG